MVQWIWATLASDVTQSALFDSSSFVLLFFLVFSLLYSSAILHHHGHWCPDWRHFNWYEKWVLLHSKWNVFASPSIKIKIHTHRARKQIIKMQLADEAPSISIQIDILIFVLFTIFFYFDSAEDILSILMLCVCFFLLSSSSSVLSVLCFIVWVRYCRPH